jgi:hypothetical protein
LEDGDVTAFACTISAASLTLGLSDLQYPIGLDYEVYAGKVVAVELQTATSNELQIGTGAEGVISPRWYLFGHGTVFAGDTNAAVVSVEAAGGGSLAAQAATMVPGEWKQLETANTFDDVAITCAESAAITTAQGGLETICGWGDTHRVLEAWGGAVYDAAENRMLFWGGGHASYGGNEVYEFDFDTLTWTRLTDPEALNVGYYTGAPYYMPRDVAPADGISDTPGATHSYGMLAWNSTNGEMSVIPHKTLYPSGSLQMGQERFYTFDPDTQAWTPHVSTGVSDNSFVTCEYVPADHETLCENGISTNGRYLYTIADDYTFTDCGTWPGMNSQISQLITDQTDGSIYDVGSLSIRKVTPNGCSSVTTHVTDIVDPPGLGYTSDRSLSGIGTGINGLWYIWDGFEKIVTFDPTTGVFALIPNAGYASTGPDADTSRGAYKTLGKWRCFPTEGVCVGITDPELSINPRGGWWMWKPSVVAPDTTPPTVALTDPADTETGVALDTVISVTFSEAMDGTTITASTFTLDDGSPVSCTVAYDVPSLTATCTPDADLADGTEHTATITTGAEDASGNALASNHVWTFTTASITNVVNLGTLALDGSTQSTLSVHMPISSGDDNNDATAYVEYRETAVGGTYTRGINLFHQRNDLTDTGDGYPYNPPGLDGMIWGLTPDTEYDIKVTVDDPDGHTGNDVQTLSAVSTKALPLSDYTGFGTTEASTVTTINAALEAACDGAGTGHIVQIPAGTTVDATGSGRIRMRNPSSPGNCGADAANPIIFRGENRDTSVIDCSDYGGTDNCIRVENSFAIIENMTIITDANHGIQLLGITPSCEVHDIAVRNVTIDRQSAGVGVVDAISFAGCDYSNIYVADNELHGPYDFPADTGGGGYKGVLLSGHDIEVEHNTIDGFIDGIAIDYITNFPVGDPDTEENHSIAVHNNLVNFGVDDGFEFDESHRDVVAHDNLFSNTPSCLSFQPVRGGPVYAVHNVCYNNSRGPLKIHALDADPTGMNIWNNSFLKNGYCWNDGQTGIIMAQVDIRNNLFYCNPTLPSSYVLNAYGTFDHDTTVFDYNAWNVDGEFEFSDGPYTQHQYSFAAWITATQGYGAHDVLTEGETTFKTLVPDFDDTAGGAVWGDHLREPLGNKFDLDSGSSAANGGVPIPGITPVGDDNPAIGACETDECDSTGTFYGVR